MFRSVAVGVGVLAGVALIEAALVPGLVIVGGAVLAPRLVRRARRSLLRSEPAAPKGGLLGSLPAIEAEKLRVSQSAAKTVTFRVFATSVDFTANYLVLGNPAIAAGLTGIGLIAGPIFYFVHETAWNHYLGPTRMTVDVPTFANLGRDGAVAAGGFQVSRAVAKTVTFRTVATVMDFSANLIVLGDLATAAGLSAVAFVLGPIVYLSHEKMWERFGPPAAEEPPGDVQGQRFLT